MEFNNAMIEATKYLNENTQDPKVKKATDLMIEHYNAPKKDYTGIQNYISGARSVNSSPVGQSSLNGVLGGIFGAKNKARDEELANKKAMDEQNRIDMENKAKQDEETAKADKLRKRKMHQQALVSSRVSSGNNQPSTQMGMMPSMGM